MPTDGNGGNLLTLIGMGSAWVIAAVTSHATLRGKVKAVDERETERHDNTQKQIDAMDKRHTEAMNKVNDNFIYIRDRIDTIIDGKKD